MTGKKKYIVIQRGSVSDECVGDENWYDLVKLKAYVAEVRGDEEYTMDRWSAISSHVFRFDYMNGITTNDRIRLEGRLFNITNVDNNSEYGVFTKLYAKEYDYES